MPPEMAQKTPCFGPPPRSRPLGSSCVSRGARTDARAPAWMLLNGELSLPDEDGPPAHADHGAALGSAFGPFRFVVVGDLGRYLPPRPARERPRYAAFTPGILELVSVDHHQKIDIGAMQGRAFPQPLQRRPIGEQE